MFGYVTINASSLPEEQKKRFTQVYCGLCHTLGEDYSLTGRTTLSYDMTFLCMLLNALYEPDEKEQQVRCPVRPWRRIALSRGEAEHYAAAMNIAFAYFKAADDVQDEHSIAARGMRRAFRPGYERVKSEYPQKCAVIEDCIRRLGALEREGCTQPDPPANTMAELFGEVYAWRDDFWAPTLRTLGGAVGRFIYLCDAVEDVQRDRKKGSYNPLLAYADRPDWQEFSKNMLTMVISEGAQAFELLPIERDAEILRNILYSGIWSRYSALWRKEAGK